MLDCQQATGLKQFLTFLEIYLELSDLFSLLVYLTGWHRSNIPTYRRDKGHLSLLLVNLAIVALLTASESICPWRVRMVWATIWSSWMNWGQAVCSNSEVLIKSESTEEERKSHKMNSTGWSFCKLQARAERQDRSSGGHREAVRLPGYSWETGGTSLRGPEGLKEASGLS